MTKKYILGIDQSTQGTKALLFDQAGKMICRSDKEHRQIIDEKGWVEHDPLEIYHNTIQVVKDAVAKSGINKSEIAAVGISNQRETALVWDRHTQEPIYNAVVWQCSRGAKICERLAGEEMTEPVMTKLVKSHTGLMLSPYFSAAKIAWVLENIEGAREKNEQGSLCCGTIDSWLVFKLTGGVEFRTDYSNASRTQMFHIGELKWDEEVCRAFGINTACLAQVTDSNGFFGETDFEGFLDSPIPIHGVLGDSHGALFGQGCLRKGMIKTTYGTGSSIMMNIGDQPVFSDQGVVTSLAWGMDGEVNYVLEGNINYTGAVITWMEKELKLITDARDTEELAKSANPADQTYLVPAFSGLGAPYWDSKATGMITGITRTTGQAEIVRAALDCIAYQIKDIVEIMRETAGATIEELRVDGGPTRNRYLMQFQSDILGSKVQVPEAEELSGIGAAFAAGISVGLYDRQQLFRSAGGTGFVPQMAEAVRKEKYAGWKRAVAMVLSQSK